MTEARLPRRVLVANRGAVAARVIRTLRRMGIESVAVYSEADAGLRHELLHGGNVIRAGGQMQDAFRFDCLDHPAAVVSVQPEEVPLRADGVGVRRDAVHAQGVLLPVKLQHRLELVGKIFDIGVVEKCAAEASHDVSGRVDEHVGRGIFEPSQL